MHGDGGGLAVPDMESRGLAVTAKCRHIMKGKHTCPLAFMASTGIHPYPPTAPEKSSMSVTTTETMPLVGAPLSRLRMSMMFCSTAGLLALRSRKNLHERVHDQQGMGRRTEPPSVGPADMPHSSHCLIRRACPSSFAYCRTPTAHPMPAPCQCNQHHRGGQCDQDEDPRHALVPRQGRCGFRRHALDDGEAIVHDPDFSSSL